MNEADFIQQLLNEQGKVLDQLDALNARIEAVLALVSPAQAIDDSCHAAISN